MMIFGSVFAATFCAFLCLMGLIKQTSLRGKKQKRDAVGQAEASSLMRQHPIRAQSGKLLSWFGQRLKLPLATADIQRLLLASGQPLQLDPHGFVVLRCVTALGGLGLAVLITPFVGRLGLLLFVVTPLAALVLPDLYLRRKVAQRIMVMNVEAADFFAVVKVTIAAGKTPLDALTQAGAVCRGELAFEFVRLANQVQLGVTRTVAYSEFLDRCPLPLARPFVAALIRSDQYGTSLTSTLTSLCAEARATQVRIMKEHAAKASPKVQLVVALLLVPAVMLIVAAALMQALVPVP